MLDLNLINIFKVLVIKKNQRSNTVVTKHALQGFITDFVPTENQKVALNLAFKPLDVITLFTVKERKEGNLLDLVTKQLLHYLEVYELDCPGLFNLEVKDGTTAVLGFVKGVTEEELGELVRLKLYTNAPFAKVKELAEIIKEYKIQYEFDKIQNNELRMHFYQENNLWTNGDDAVRYIVFVTTGETLLIKSPSVLAAVKLNAAKISNRFLMQHRYRLSEVFNRHKKIIMSLKTEANKSTINKISHLSKKHHVPLHEAFNKTFMAKVLSGQVKDVSAALSAISVRDKFKYLNLIEWKTERSRLDTFIIRNGKVHLTEDRKIFKSTTLANLREEVLLSLGRDLDYLRDKNILLDANVSYGLPISQKQTLGNLPFGTEVAPEGNKISSGIYWENAWGAFDLDLSAIDTNGDRTGWGQYSGYSKENPITFSGDLTDARNGAMEFLTSGKDFSDTYGLFVSNYRGEDNSKFELVIGNQTKDRWIKNPLVREKSVLRGKTNIIGFVRQGKFIVFYCQPSNSRISGGEVTKNLVAKGLAYMWTLDNLFDHLGIQYDQEADPQKEYDHNLSYSNFSLDKLEAMVYNQ